LIWCFPVTISNQQAADAFVVERIEFYGQQEAMERYNQEIQKAQE
jgi:hypothetical protein